MKKILIYSPKIFFSSLQETLEKCSVKYNLISDKTCLLSTYRYELKDNNSYINPNVRYECLAIDFTSFKNFEKIFIKNSAVPRLIKVIAQIAADAIINGNLSSKYKKQISFILSDSVTDKGSANYSAFCVKDDENEVLYYVEGTREKTSKTDKKHYEVFVGWPDCAN